jgi:hypothetical protein
MSTLDQERRYAAVRTALLGYGIAAYGYLLGRPAPHDAQALGIGGSASTFMLSGVGLQIVLILVRIIIKRVVPDRELAGQASLIVELFGDGVTVLLFALATLGAIVHAPEQL